MLLLSHSSSLCVHLLESFVLRKLLGHLAFELVLHSLFFCESFGLEFHLVIFGSLQFLFLSVSFFPFCLFCSPGSLLLLLHLKIVTHVLDILVFSSACSFLGSQLLEYRISLRFSRLLHGLQLVRPLLLLALELFNKLIFILFKLPLSFEQCVFLINRQNHVLFALLLLHFVDSHHFMVFLNHFIDYGVDLVTLFNVLKLSLLSEHFLLLHLVLDSFLHIKQLHGLGFPLLHSHQVADFFSS